MQQDVILKGVKTDDEVGNEGAALRNMAVEALQGLIMLIDHLNRHARQNNLAIGNTARNPLSKEMARAREAGSLGDDLRVTGAGADEEDEAGAIGDLLDDAGGAAEVRGGLLERDDVDALAHAEDVARVGRVPQRCVVAHVRLRRQQQLQRHVARPRRPLEHVARPVRRLHPRPHLPHQFSLQRLRSVIVLRCRVRLRRAPRPRR